MAISAELKAEIMALLEKAKGGEKLVSMIDKILALLKKSGLAWSQKLLPHQVGCHPRNRDGLGISTSEVHGLITDIVQVGFSPDEVRCICFETDPSKTEVVDFNRRLHRESAGKLASLNTELIRYASVSGSHLNAGLNCWIHGVMHDNPACTGPDGKLSLAKLSEMDKAYHAACTEGLPWLVVSSQVDHEFPELPHLLQSSMNVASHLSRSESELQLLRKIWAAVVAQMGQGKTVITWNDVKTAVLRSKPTLAMTCPMMFGFVLKFSGGVSGHLMDETESFIRAHGHARRSLGPDVFAALSQDLKGTEQYAKYRHCALIVIELLSYFAQWFMLICINLDGT